MQKLSLLPVLAVLGITLLLVLVVAILRGYSEKKVYAEIYSCPFKEVTSILGMPIYERSLGDYLTKHGRVRVTADGYSHFTGKQAEVWVEIDEEDTLLIISGMAGIVQSSSYWSHQGILPRSLTEEAKHKLVRNVLWLWTNKDIDAAGNYLTGVIEVIYRTNNAPGIETLDVSELPGIQDFLSNYEPSDQWIQYWMEG